MKNDNISQGHRQCNILQKSQRKHEFLGSSAQNGKIATTHPDIGKVKMYRQVKSENIEMLIVKWSKVNPLSIKYKYEDSYSLAGCAALLWKGECLIPSM